MIARSQFYRFDVLHDDNSLALTETEIENNLRSIIDDARVASDAEVAAGAVGVLTGDRRPRWAAHRRTMLKASEQNRKSFYDLDAALFIVCLDDIQQSVGAPETA